jgi:hypothetical protein
VTALIGVFDRAVTGWGMPITWDRKVPPDGESITVLPHDPDRTFRMVMATIFGFLVIAVIGRLLVGR